MTNVYQYNTHFQILTGEIWDLESMQDAVRDIIAPYSVSKGSCNLVLDLSQLSERHLYNKAFVLSVKRFVDNIYGVKIAILVIPNKDEREKVTAILNHLSDIATSKTAHWEITESYQLAKIIITRGI